MPREHVRSKRIPEISCNLSREQCASDGVFFRVIALVVEKNIFAFLGAPTLDKLKI